MCVRSAAAANAAAIAGIYNEGIEDGIATFETEHRTEADVARSVSTVVTAASTASGATA